MTVLFTKVRDVKLPERGTKLSSGIDFFIPNNIDELVEGIKFTPLEHLGDKAKQSMVNDNVDFSSGTIRINPGTGILIPSGLKVILPSSTFDFETYEMVIYNKSGISTKTNLLVGAQVIDNDYRGEFSIHLVNCGGLPVVIQCGQKIAQGIVRTVELNPIKEISEQQFNSMSNTERGSGGFGSTGK